MTPDDALSCYLHLHTTTALQGLSLVPADATADESGAAEARKELDRLLGVETVHGVRTSLRRVRAALLLIDPVPPVPALLDDDLRGVSRALSEVRDAAVLTASLLAEIDGLPAQHVHGTVRADLLEALAVKRRDGLDVVRRSRGEPSWQRALEQLEAWRHRPPRLTAGPPLLLLDQARAEVRRRLRDADGDHRGLHAARRAAKRWRYAAELLCPALPEAAAHFAAATLIHERLGTLQDAVVARDFLAGLARAGAESGRDVATTQLLHQRAQQRIDEAVSHAPELLVPLLRPVPVRPPSSRSQARSSSVTPEPDRPPSSRSQARSSSVTPRSREGRGGGPAPGPGAP